jgi:hypothetical protein
LPYALTLELWVVLAFVLILFCEKPFGRLWAIAKFS